MWNVGTSYFRLNSEAGETAKSLITEGSARLL